MQAVTNAVPESRQSDKEGGMQQCPPAWHMHRRPVNSTAADGAYAGKRGSAWQNRRANRSKEPEHASPGLTIPPMCC